MKPLDEQPPAWVQASLATTLIERIMVQLPLLDPFVDRAPIVATLEAAVTLLTELQTINIEDSRHIEWLKRSIQRIDDVHIQLIGIPSSDLAARMAIDVKGIHQQLSKIYDETLERIAEHQGQFLQEVRSSIKADKGPVVAFLASRGFPHLHEISRQPLRSGVDARPDEDAEDKIIDVRPSPLQHQQDSTEQDKQSASQQNPVVKSCLTHLRRLARDCIEEIGNMGMLRSPSGPPVPWASGILQFEQRLLNDLDALIALGQPFQYGSLGNTACLDVLSVLLDVSRDAFVPDPGRAFARTFVLGSVMGQDTVRAAIMGLRQADPVTYSAHRDAFALAPNPDIALAMQSLCTEQDPVLVQIALDVLQMRREATLEVVGPLLAHPTMGVRMRAAHCLSGVNPADAAIQLLQQRLQVDDDDRVIAAVAKSLLMLHVGSALHLVRQRLIEESQFAGVMVPDARKQFLRWLAFAGDASDIELFQRLLNHKPYEAEAMGWYGHPQLIPVLVAALADARGIPARAAFARATAHALVRITGLRPEDPVLTDSDRWKDLLKQHEGRFSGVQKLRFGRPFSPLITLDEAESPDTLTDIHHKCLLELSILGGTLFGVRSSDWVCRQRAELATFRQMLNSSHAGLGSYRPGQWPAATLTRVQPLSHQPQNP